MMARAGCVVYDHFIKTIGINRLAFAFYALYLGSKF